MNEEIKKIIRDLMEDPTCTCDMYRGMKKTSKKSDSTETFEPTDAKTIVLQVRGGANNVRIQSIKTEDDED